MESWISKNTTPLRCRVSAVCHAGPGTEEMTKGSDHSNLRMPMDDVDEVWMVRRTRAVDWRIWSNSEVEVESLEVE
jgi:hypothetical protein